MLKFFGHALPGVRTRVSLCFVLGLPLAAMPVHAQGPFAYVANESSNTVSVVDTTTNPPSLLTTIGGFNCPRGVAVTPDADRVYVTNICGNNVSVISTATNMILTTLAVGGSPWGVAVSPDGTRAYVANPGSSSVTVIDNTLNPPAVLTTIGGFSNVYYATVHPDGSRLYVTSCSASTVYEVSTATNMIVTSVGTGSCPFGVAVTADGDHLYVANQSGQSVSVYDATTSPPSSLTTIGLPCCYYPFEVAVTPDDTRAYVTTYNGLIGVIDNTAGPPSLLTTFSVGSAWGVAIMPDSASAYVTNRSSSVLKISTSTNLVTDTVGVGSQPTGIAITPKLADLSIVKSDLPDPVVTGSNITYTITVANGGPQTAESVVVSDELDASTSFVSCLSTGSGVCGGGGNSRSVSFPSMAASTSEAITLVAKVNDNVADGTLISNEATLASGTFDPDGSDNSDATVTTASNPPPLLTCPANMNVPATFGAGAMVSYPTASVSDNTPGTTVAFSPASGSTLPIGTTMVTATATDAGGEQASCTFDVTVFNADLAISLSATPEPVKKGANLTYTITVQNLSADAAGSLLMNDAIPAQTSFVSVAPGAWSCAAPPVGSTGTVSCTLASLGGGSSSTIGLVIKVNPGFKKTTVSNTASVNAAVYDPNPGNNSATRVTVVKNSGK